MEAYLPLGCWTCHLCRHQCESDLCIKQRASRLTISDSKKSARWLTKQTLSLLSKSKRNACRLAASLRTMLCMVLKPSNMLNSLYILIGTGMISVYLCVAYFYIFWGLELAIPNWRPCLRANQIYHPAAPGFWHWMGWLGLWHMLSLPPPRPPPWLSGPWCHCKPTFPHRWHGEHGGAFLEPGTPPHPLPVNKRMQCQRAVSLEDSRGR